MGCDIHLHVEYKDHKSWWNAPMVAPRDYGLFSHMGDVRGETGYHEGRGLPKDVSMRVKEEFEGDFNHSPSWMTVVEFYSLLSYVTLHDGSVSPLYEAALAYAVALERAGFEVRFVFYFDN